jgi:hypothetical protein
MALETKTFLKDERSLWQAMQLNIKEIIKPEISERILIPAMVFMIDIFDLKITEII